MAIADRYRIYAEYVRPRSACVADLALMMADDAEVMRVLDTLNVHKRRPSMVIAVLRLMFHQIHDWPALRARFLADPQPVLAQARRRSINVTEPARLAALLPLLALIEAPIALIDVGASLGLCLLPDRYSYRYSGGAVLPGERTHGLEVPVFDCAAGASVPLPR